MQHMWELHKAEEEWGFLLIDARNAFNEMNRTVMLWTVRHEWPSGARFTFNCYKHWGTLVIRNNNGSGTFIYSKEGVTQGDPLSMFAYGVGLLPLIRALKKACPEVVQTWYADDAGAAGKFKAIKQQFAKLQEIGPHYGYYPEPTKSILIVSQNNLAAATAAFKDSEFTITTGNRYLGGFIGEKDALVIVGLRRKSNVGWKGSRRLPLWQSPTHRLPMQGCRRRISSSGSLYRECVKESVRVSPRFRKQFLKIFFPLFSAIP
jgi:hypothetical protein